MKLVKFNDGQYGIRKRYFIFWFIFYDFQSSRNYWWSLNKYPNDIKTTKEHAEKQIEVLNDYGSVV